MQPIHPNDHRQFHSNSDDNSPKSGDRLAQAVVDAVRLMIDLTMIPAGQFVMVSIYESNFGETSPDPVIEPYVQYLDAMASVVLQVI
jgi:hypothetical protein